MARTTKRGICELCGANSNVGTNHGSKVCTNCTHIQSALSKRPQSVANAIRAMHKTEEMLGHLIPAGGGIAVKVTADLLQEISGIVGYEGEDPAELVGAVRRVASGGDQQLTSEAEAGALRTIAGIVGYDGTDGSEVVAAVRRRVLTCASCEAEDVLHEIRQIVEYSPDMGDSGLADAVRAFADRRPAYVPDCTECDAAAALLEIAELGGKRGASSGLVVGAVQELVERAATLSATGDFLRGELLRACGLEMDDTEDGEGWDVAVAAAIQTIAELINNWGDLLRQLTRERGDNARLTLAEKARDEWKQRAVQAESSVETLEAELRNRENTPSPCRLISPKDFENLLNVAIAAMRCPYIETSQLADEIEKTWREL